MTFLKSTPGEDPIRIEVVLAASPAEVFDAFTDPQKVRAWFGPRPGALHSAAIDLRVGGVWRFVESMDKNTQSGFEGRYELIDPNTRLVFTWSKFSTREGQVTRTEHSRVALDFVATGDGTLLRIVHSQIDTDTLRRGFAGGWSQGLENLIQTLNKP